MKIDTRRQELLDLGRGKDVLVLGPLGTYDRYRAGTAMEIWDFKYLTGIASSVLGLDVNEELIKVAVEDGWNIELGDAEAFNLGRMFDLIFSADLIEHLGRPLDFLLCAARHLKPGGVIVVETPNPIGIDTLLRALVTGDKKSSEVHCCWIDEWNAQELGRRAGLKCRTVKYTPISQFAFWQAVRCRIYRFISSLRPALAARLSTSTRSSRTR